MDEETIKLRPGVDAFATGSIKKILLSGIVQNAIMLMHR
jgi:hypothetical protein